MAEFTNYTKFSVRTWEDCNECQRDRSRLGKCKVVHNGAQTPNSKSMLMGSELVVTDQEGDLGVLVANSLSMSTQVSDCSKKKGGGGKHYAGTYEEGG